MQKSRSPDQRIGSLPKEESEPLAVESASCHAQDGYVPPPFGQGVDQEYGNISDAHIPQSSPVYMRDSRLGAVRRVHSSLRDGPHTLRTLTSSASMPERTYRDRAIADSPTHQSQFMPLSGFPSTLRETLSEDAAYSSPKPERLPSFRQLSKIADGGTDGTPTSTAAYPAVPSHISVQSPTKTLPYFTASQQPSPPNNYALLTHPAPTLTHAESHDAFPVQHPSVLHTAPIDNTYQSRRRSQGLINPPPFLTTLTSSSTETNISRQSSTGDGYSTTSTTPLESGPTDGSQKQSAFLPPGLQHSSSSGGSFICDYPGCNAQPFQTQYLLNSHANVHSSNRPHYCPVRGCPRSEGGKGFKRKNEMIRHGLVHDSPGYICPFCPLREHKYPRPDNLQRHVRVHHVDKDKDDPLLREVLAQRPEGGPRGRRRRTGP